LYFKVLLPKFEATSIKAFNEDFVSNLRWSQHDDYSEKNRGSAPGSLHVGLREDPDNTVEEQQAWTSLSWRKDRQSLCSSTLSDLITPRAFSKRGELSRH